MPNPDVNDAESDATPDESDATPDTDDGVNRRLDRVLNFLFTYLP